MTYPNDPQQPGQPPYGQPPYGQPPYDPNQQYPQQTQYPQPAYGEPQYGAPPSVFPESQYTQPAYGAAGAAPGFAPTAPPSGNKKGWIIGGVIAALVAIAAVVVVIVMNGGDDNTTANGSAPAGSSQGGAGSGSGSGESGAMKTDPTCDYGLKVDPKTGETVECTGGQQQQQQTTEDASNFDGSWTVTSTLTSSTGEWTDSAGATLTPGATVIDATWLVIVGACGADECSAFVTTQTDTSSASLEFEWDGTAWQSSFTYESPCTIGSATTTQIEGTYSLVEIDPDRFEGTSQLTTDGSCGSVDTMLQDVTLVRQ